MAYILSFVRRGNKKTSQKKISLHSSLASAKRTMKEAVSKLPPYSSDYYVISKDKYIGVKVQKKTKISKIK